MLQSTPDERTNQQAAETAHAQHVNVVARYMERLDDRETQIIRYLYGFGAGREPMSLRDVGRVMGVTKERIRQLQFRAIAKLRQVAEKERGDMPDDSGVEERKAIAETADHLSFIRRRQRKEKATQCSLYCNLRS